MRGMTAIAAAQIATETATAETATAIETCDATVRGIRAGTAVHAETIRVPTLRVPTTALDHQNGVRMSREPSPLGKTNLAKSRHFGPIRRLGLIRYLGRIRRLVLQTRLPDPTNRRAWINPAPKASDPPMSVASAEDAAVADAVAADAMAVKTMRMA